MLKTGKTYRTVNGKQRFFIHATRNTPSSNGANFIGEDLKSGTIVCFTYKGEHPWHKDLNLDCDPYTWCGVFDEKKNTGEFVKKEKLGGFAWYLRMENNDPLSIIAMDHTSFLNTYAYEAKAF